VLFRDGRTGRRAVLVGGPEVREVFQGGALGPRGRARPGPAAIVALVEANTGVAARLVETAVRYWPSYPNEIDAWIRDVGTVEADALTAWERAQDLLAR